MLFILQRYDNHLGLVTWLQTEVFPKVNQNVLFWH